MAKWNKATRDELLHLSTARTPLLPPAATWGSPVRRSMSGAGGIPGLRTRLSSPGHPVGSRSMTRSGTLPWTGDRAMLRLIAERKLPDWQPADTGEDNHVQQAPVRTLAEMQADERASVPLEGEVE